MYKVILLSLTILLVSFAGSALYAQDDMSGVVVTGTAEVKAQPDIAHVTFGVTTEAADANEAARTNAQRTQAVIDAIIRFGVPRANIETVQYSVNPIQDYKASPPTTVGYRVSNQVRVKLTDIPRIGALIDAAIRAGANDVQGVTFTVENDQAIRQEAIVQAIRNAQAKAKVIADTLGIRLGQVTYVSESFGGIPRPLQFGVARADVETPIVPGQVDITATVTIAYAIL